MTELSVSVSLEDHGGGARTVVRLVGEADVTTGALAEVLDAEVAKKPSLLLVDISGLMFLDSAALNQIVQAHRKLSADGGRLELVGPCRAVARMLQLSAVDKVIPVRASTQEPGAAGEAK